MRVLIYATGADTGGQGIRIHDGFVRHAPDWTVDFINNGKNSLGYPEQYSIPIVERERLAKELYQRADVVHLRNTLDGWKRLDRGQCKPIVLHEHGSVFRRQHRLIAEHAKVINATVIAATLDLTLLEPNVEWVPAPYSIPELQALRAKHYQPSDKVRIAHFPTNVRVKSSREFLDAVDLLKTRYPIELLSNLRRGKVVNMQWPDVMGLKAQADILYDQVILGYGNNAIEAWGMGIPVVAGIEDPKVRRLMVQRFGELPFAEATAKTLAPVLEKLVRSQAMRSEYGEKGLAHAIRFHDEAKVVTQLQDVYSRAVPSVSADLPRIPGWLLARMERKAARAAA